MLFSYWRWPPLQDYTRGDSRLFTAQCFVTFILPEMVFLLSTNMLVLHHLTMYSYNCRDILQRSAQYNHNPLLWVTEEVSSEKNDARRQLTGSCRKKGGTYVLWFPCFHFQLVPRVMLFVLDTLTSRRFLPPAKTCDKEEKKQVYYQVAEFRRLVMFAFEWERYKSSSDKKLGCLTSCDDKPKSWQWIIKVTMSLCLLCSDKWSTDLETVMRKLS